MTRSRPNLMRVLIAATLCAVAVVSASPARGTNSLSSPQVLPPIQGLVPNVLIIVTDDQRTKLLRTMPQTKAFFYDGGTRFPNGYVTTPLCCPSRGSIFTGRYAHNHGILHNNAVENLDQTTTMQYHLQQNGYKTGIVGKFFRGWDVAVDPPYFDLWSIFRAGYYGRSFNTNGALHDVGRYSTTYIGNESERFLREFEKDDLTPWYLYVATAAPHKPFTASSKYRGTHIRDWKGNPGVRERNTGDKPPFIQEHHSGIVRGNRVRKKQIRTLKSVDDMVTQIKGVLDELGETRDTLAIFTSDNGYLLGEHGFVGKRQPYTDSIEVPLVVRLPGVLPRGGVDHRFAANVDIAPTVLEAAKVPAEDMSSMDGYSLLGDHDRTYMFTEHWGNPHKDLSDWASIRTRDYQYTEYYTRLPGEDSDTISFREYYDLKEDPYELVNLYANHDQQDDPNPVPLGATVEGFRTCSEDSCP